MSNVLESIDCLLDILTFNSKNVVISCSAPGKIILSGEHAVVYNKKALVTSINKRCYGKLYVVNNNTNTVSLNFNKDIEIEWNLKSLIQFGLDLNSELTKSFEINKFLDRLQELK